MKDLTQAARIARRVDREFENAPFQTRTDPEGAYAQATANQVGNIALVTAVIAGAVFFTLVLVTGTIMAQSVRERAGELGMLKAIGFTNGRVLWLVLGESCALALTGGLPGLGLAWLLIARGDPTGGMLPQFHLSPRDLGAGAALCVVLGLLAGIGPGLQVTRLRPAAALKRM